MAEADSTRWNDDWTRRVTRARAYDASFSLLPLEFSLFLKTASQNLTDRIFDKDAFESRAVFYVHNKLSKMKNCMELSSLRGLYLPI